LERRILIKRGHDIKISGVPDNNNIISILPKNVCIMPSHFRGIKPKLVVKKNDIVKIGSPLFFDKKNPKVHWGSPGNGIVKNIIFGPRRVIEKIEIEIDGVEVVKHKKYNISEISSLDRRKVLDYILKANLFPIIRQRPFNKVPDPNDIPRDIFISALNTAPLSIDLNPIIEKNKNDFQAAVTALSKLTTGNVYICSNKPIEFENAINQVIKGPHPAGNIGIQVHHIKPLKPNETIWTVDAQNVVILGKLFLQGQYSPKIEVSIGGPASTNPQICSTIVGCNISEILVNQNLSDSARIISGDVLTGKKVSESDYIGYYDSIISLLLDSVDRPFMGMLALGSSKTKYSLTNTFFGFGNQLFDFNTGQKGELRPMVPLNAWEKVLPMDIYPNHLYRSILAEDIEEMEQLGIWECDDEDFALCSFACPSKIDVGEVIRYGLDLIEADS